MTTNKTLNNTEKITQIEIDLKAQIGPLEKVIQTNEEQIKNLAEHLDDAQQQLKTMADVIKARDEQIKELEFRLANNMSRDSVESFISESDVSAHYGYSSFVFRIKHLILFHCMRLEY